MFRAVSFFFFLPESGRYFASSSLSVELILAYQSLIFTRLFFFSFYFSFWTPKEMKFKLASCLVLNNFWVIPVVSFTIQGGEEIIPP